MKNPVWLVALAAALLVVFGGGYWLGERTGVVALDGGSTSGSSLVGTDEGGSPGRSDVVEDGTFDQADEIEPDAAPGGLEISDGGYVLQPVTRALVVNKKTEYAFRLVGPDGVPVSRFERPYGRDVSLFVARRDLSCYAIAQPVLGGDGVWRAPLTLPAAGQYRMVVDFTPAGSEQSVILGVDVPAPGSYSLAPQPRPSAPAEVDGYRVVLSGELEAGRASTIRLTISRGGKPVTDLEPHMASYGHLVALRDGDMAVLRATAEGKPGDGRIQPGPGVGFEVQVPTKSTYGLYFEFRHAGKLHSATFTAIAS